MPLGEQLGASGRELHVSPGLVQPKPATLDRELEAGAVFGRAALELGQERPADLLNLNSAVLHWLDGAGDLHQLSAPRYRSPGHHVDGGSLAEILVVRSATRWLRLYGQPRNAEQSLQRMYRSNSWIGVVFGRQTMSRTTV